MSETMIKGWRVRLAYSPSPGYYTQDWADVEYDREIARDEDGDESVIQVEEITKPASWWDDLETNANEFPGW